MSVSQYWWKYPTKNLERHCYHVVVDWNFFSLHFSFIGCLHEQNVRNTAERMHVMNAEVFISS